MKFLPFERKDHSTKDSASAIVNLFFILLLFLPSASG